MHNDHKLESWMFRYPLEYFALFSCLMLLVGLAVLLSTFNIFIFIGALIVGLFYIRLQQAQYIGNAIRIHENQFPEIFEIFKRNALKLNISKANLYIKQDPYLNASTIGIFTGSVVLNSALVEQLNKKELDFVIGHELGHFKAGHTKISSLFIPLGVNNIISSLIFGFWQRKAEHTGDRCGLVLTKDIDSAITGLLKIALGGVLFSDFNSKGYISQLRKADSINVKFSEILVDHPLFSSRIKDLMQFWKENFKS